LKQTNALGGSMCASSSWLHVNRTLLHVAQGGGERARRLRGQHRSSVPVFTIKPLGSELRGAAAADLGDPGLPSAAAAACHSPRITAHAAAEGDEDADARAPRSAAVRMSCPVGPSARGRTPLAFRCARHLLLERAVQ